MIKKVTLRKEGAAVPIDQADLQALNYESSPPRMTANNVADNTNQLRKTVMVRSNRLDAGLPVLLPISRSWFN